MGGARWSRSITRRHQRFPSLRPPGPWHGRVSRPACPSSTVDRRRHLGGAWSAGLYGNSGSGVRGVGRTGVRGRVRRHLTAQTRPRHESGAANALPRRARRWMSQRHRTARRCGWGIRTVATGLQGAASAGPKSGSGTAAAGQHGCRSSRLAWSSTSWVRWQAGS